MTTSNAEKSKQIIAQIDQIKRNLHESGKNKAILLTVENDIQQCVDMLEAKEGKARRKIKELEDKLDREKQYLTGIETRLATEMEKRQQNCKGQQELDAQIADSDKRLGRLNNELEELRFHTVYLVAPMYVISKIPKELFGRTVSTAEIDGVETEHPEKGNADRSYLEVADFFEKIGYTDLREVRVAYEFALLVCQYMSDASYEVHVLNEEERLQKLIDWLTT